MYWRDDSGFHIILGNQYELPMQIDSSKVCLRKGTKACDFMILNEYAVVVDVLDEFQVTSVEDELFVTNLHLIVDDQLITACWSCTYSFEPKFDTKVRYSGLKKEAEDKLDHQFKYLIKSFRQDSKVSSAAYNVGQRNIRYFS